MKLQTFVKKCTAGALALALGASLLTAAFAPNSVAYAASAGVTQPYESIFQGDRIIDVKVTIDEDDWQSILDSPLDKDYKSVTVEVDGQKLDNVGFSTKGNMTLRSVAGMSDSDRYSFRLKFDKYDKSQTLQGLDKMVLNNSYTDPSFLREYLHYEALRAIGMDAPLTVFTNLYINGELFGFYIGVESIDDSYLARTVGSDYKDGILYDTDEKSYLQYVEGSNYDTLTEDLGSDEDKAKLKNFIKVLNDMPAGEKGGIESVLDVDSALQYIAANAVLGNYDSYNGDKGHNYMLYGDANGKFSVLPWDFNMSFNGYSAGTRGAGTTGSGTVNTNAVTAAVDVPVLGISIESVPMINNLLKVEEYKAKYISYVKQLVNYLTGIEDRVAELAALIRPSIQADPTKFYTMEQFEANITYSASSDAVSGMGDMTLPEGTEGMTPPEGMEGMTPPEGMEGMTLPDGQTAPVRTNGQSGTRPEPPTGMVGEGAATNAGNGTERQAAQGQGQGQGTMAAGSLMTFALNRLANLQQQLGLEVIKLPSASVNSEGSTTGTNSTAADITVELDGKQVVFADQQPVTVNGRTLVPVKAIFDALGGTVKWDQASKTVTAVVNGQTIVLTIGNSIAYIDGKEVKLDVPAATLNDRTVVPVRFIAEGLGMSVDWSSATRRVTITSK